MPILYRYYLHRYRYLLFVGLCFCSLAIYAAWTLPVTVSTLITDCSSNGVQSGLSQCGNLELPVCAHNLLGRNCAGSHQGDGQIASNQTIVIKLRRGPNQLQFADGSTCNTTVTAWLPHSLTLAVAADTEKGLTCTIIT